MNFGYPNTPYAANIGEQYMGNVANPNMGYASQMECMQQPQTNYGTQMPFMNGFNQQGCGQVLQQTCAVDMPYYVNYNTHVVNNVIRRHIQIPVYTQTQETVYIDEWQTGCGCGCNR